MASLHYSAPLYYTRRPVTHSVNQSVTLHHPDSHHWSNWLPLHSTTLGIPTSCVIHLCYTERIKEQQRIARCCTKHAVTTTPEAWCRLTAIPPRTGGRGSLQGPPQEAQHCSTAHTPLYTICPISDVSHSLFLELRVQWWWRTTLFSCFLYWPLALLGVAWGLFAACLVFTLFNLCRLELKWSDLPIRNITVPTYTLVNPPPPFQEERSTYDYAVSLTLPIALPLLFRLVDTKPIFFSPV